MVMTEIGPGFMVAQLEGLQPTVPSYDYEGLKLPACLELNAYFGSHEDKGDPDELRTRLMASDIIVLESFGWHPDLPKMFQKVSRGDYETRSRWLAGLQMDGSVQSEWAAQTVRALYNVRKPVVITDIPDGNSIYKALKKSMDRREPGEDFSEAVKLTRKQELEYAELNLQRENYMLRSFVEQINDITQANPKLRQKLHQGEPVKLQTIDFGLVHAGLFEGIHEVARRCGAVIIGEVVFDRTGASYHSQVVGRYNRGIDIDEELIAKVLVCKKIAEQIMTESPGTSRSEAEYVAMQQLDALGLVELEEIYKRFV